MAQFDVNSTSVENMREVMIQKWRERHGESDDHSGNDQPVYGSAD